MPGSAFQRAPELGREPEVSGPRSAGYRAMALLARGAMSLGVEKRGLRVLGYHDVPDGDALHDQLEWLQRDWHVISLEEAMEGLRSGAEMGRAVVVTFDDGDPTVVDRGRPVLDSLGIKGVMFICPGVVDTGRPYWWQVVEAAGGRGIEIEGRPLDGSSVSGLKTVADSSRRELAQSLLSDPRMAGFEVRQITTRELESWVEAGHSVGNHTWDHPLLDTCEPDEQRSQIERAHSWLTGTGLMSVPVFAYPNGNWAAHSEAVLRELGYTGALLFDHRVHAGHDPLRVSRLRVNVEDTSDVFVSKVSGLHSVAHGLVGRA